MPFENLDKKIKEAADQHHPAYDEKAWQKMEKLLNEHLPQPKKDRRRILFWLLLFLSVGGGTFMLISKPWEKTSTTASTPKPENNNNRSTELTKASNGATATSKTDKLNRETITEKAVDVTQTNQKNILDESNKILIIKSQKKIFKNQPRLITNTKVEDTSPIVQNNKNRNDASVADDNKESTLTDNPRTPVDKQAQGERDITKAGDNERAREETKQANKTAGQEIAKSEPPKTNNKKNRRMQTGNGFSFSVSAGPDVTKVGSSETGKVTLAYGFGIGYTRNRFTLRTGVYSAKKIYTAEAKYYKLGYALPATSTFESADANCSVLEIPVKVDYNMNINEKSNWFVSAGLSSYLMKEEKYVYNIKTNWGYYPRDHNVSNKNKHYFSVLDLSAGYTRGLGNIFSITAEPYIEIPLTGIGEGKVKLKSGGVLFTLGVKPFKK